MCLCFQVFELSEQDITNQLFEKDASLRQCQVCLDGTDVEDLSSMSVLCCGVLEVRVAESVSHFFRGWFRVCL